MTLTIIKPAFSGLDLESKLKEYNHFLKEVLRGDVIDVDPIRKYFQGQGVDDFTISESFGKDLKKQSEEMTPPIPTYRQVQIDHTLLTSSVPHHLYYPLVHISIVRINSKQIQS